ncbi:Aminobenzoyl-glutamate transport protein [Pseudonocardia sp. Ae168_Ps1]|uniref:AbgT family transporter n=1 Tax=unclassified Pseudonocardia TaxID=2619320 RepID=UPI00094AF2A7|nr:MULTISPECIES: AbgT family transporter [unclassified Pseudonocardia]OLL76731.1 Aminobenzoyl-glutamate transport protein [Pseudonocardia sp. Ae150A_Ps1]OLL82743.1 Aminobenzoyl-glutamate transport protein [Pseudonocardia sp. Ae168_Ps1]OLL83144.1 Aminobenzoyl-glutamate transport protein [Pseudonocardia sp. Ae263_Ps1]OLL90818.1 Aminobenzoyl-glutamate transport protein [Pseudonocardia sp. Ae356_Ps1]
MSEQTAPETPSRLTRALGVVERAGNKLPDPVILFVVLSVLLAGLSAVLAAAGLTAQVPGQDEITPVRSLLTGDGLRFALTEAVTNFVEFPPLGTIIAVLLGIAVADRSGLLPTLLRVTVLRAPRPLVTPALMFAGVCGSVASDAAYIVLIPLGAMVFRTLGRNPAVGAVAAFVSVGAGYDASILVTATDVLLAGITNSAAAVVDPSIQLTALSNYWFNVVSALLIALAAAVVVDRVVEPAAGRSTEEPADASGHEEAEAAEARDAEISRDQVRGLRDAGLTLLALLALYAAAWLPAGSPLRDPDTGDLVPSPFLDGIAVVLLLTFLAVGIVYGLRVGTVRRAADVPRLMREGLVDVVPILVLFFVIAQFLAWFTWTGLGQWIAVSGAEVLQASGAPAPVLLFLTMLLVFVLGLVITSGSAQWSLLAPVLVPMLLLVGIDADQTMAAFRIGDSVANSLTPMSPYFAVALGFLQRYRRDAGIGTLISMTLPICAAMFVVWTVLFLAWVSLGIPLGV